MPTGSLAFKIGNRSYGYRNMRTDPEVFTVGTGEDHNNEIVGSRGGVRFIDDSAAVRANHTWLTMENIISPIIWITGDSVDKPYWRYDDIARTVRKRVKAIILLGEGDIAHNIIKLFSGQVLVIINTESMNEAVYYSTLVSKSGDTVLLSPGCASFGMFENYRDRGEQFQNIVKNKILV